jgi:hypothetical protein
VLGALHGSRLYLQVRKMIYFLLVVFLQDGVGIESYSTKAECEIRRQAIRIESPGLNTQCIRMESKGVV